MSATTTRQPASPIVWAMPILADLLGVGFFAVANVWLTTRFSRSAIDFTALQDAGLFALFHLAFLFGITFIRKLKGADLFPVLKNNYVLGLFAAPYGLAFMFAIADLSSYLDTLFTVNFGDIGNGYYFLVTPAIYLFVGLLYLFILIQPAELTLDPQKWTLPSLLLTNLMLAAAASYLAAVIPQLFPNLANFPTAVLAFIVLAILFSLPRLIYYAKSRNFLAVVSFDVALLFYAFAIGFW
jgi:hypothetical protein